MNTSHRKTLLPRVVFYMTTVLAMIATIAIVVSTRTSAHYSWGSNLSSLEAGAMRLTHAVPGRMYFSVPSGFSMTDAAALTWSPLADSRAGCWVIHVPLWLPALACGCIAMAMYRRAFFPAGICRGCKYDLAGLESDRCPECGRMFEPARAAIAATAVV